jgi:hypothetical protein
MWWRMWCLMSSVSRALAQSFLTAQSSSFAVTPSRRFIPSTDAVRITPIATTLLRRKHDAMGQKPSFIGLTRDGIRAADSDLLSLRLSSMYMMTPPSVKLRQRAPSLRRASLGNENNIRLRHIQGVWHLLFVNIEGSIEYHATPHGKE